MKRGVLFVSLIGAVLVGTRFFTQNAQSAQTTPAAQQPPIVGPTVTGELSFASRRSRSRISR